MKFTRSELGEAKLLEISLRRSDTDGEYAPVSSLKQEKASEETRARWQAKPRSEQRHNARLKAMRVAKKRKSQGLCQ